MSQGNNPTLKGRLLSLEKQAKEQRTVLQNNQNQIKLLLSQIQQGTQSTVLQDKIAYIKDLLVQKLQRVDYKMKKHFLQQKQKNNQLVQLIGVVKGQKNELQRWLAQLELRLQQIQRKIQGDQIA